MAEIELRDQSLYFKQADETVLVLAEKTQGKQVTISLEGSVLYDFAPFLGEELLLASYAFDRIVLDLAQTRSLCASCYDDFLDLQKQMENRKGAEFYLLHPPQAVLEEIRQIGYSYILDIREE